MTRAAWYPAATRRDGPAWKTSGDRTSTRAAVYHSVEGTLSAALGVLSGSREASWHLTNPKVGKMLQHYSLAKLCWHAKGGNDWSPGVENEGRVGEPLTESQVQNLADFSAWQVEESWLPRLTRGGSGQTLWEHNEVGRQASPPYVTACPSGRIPWAEIIRRAEKEDDMPYSFIVQEQDGGEEGVWMVSGDLMSRWRIFGWGHVDQFRYTLEAQGGKAREPQRRDISRPPAGYLASIRNVGAPRQG